MAGGMYIGLGCRQRGLDRSVWANEYKVFQYGKAAAVQQFGEKLRREKSMRGRLWTSSGMRLICHCLLSQPCHEDEIIREYQNLFPTAFDRESPDARR